jgi:hypothetical protein
MDNLTCDVEIECYRCRKPVEVKDVSVFMPVLTKHMFCVGDNYVDILRFDARNAGNELDKLRVEGIDKLFASYQRQNSRIAIYGVDEADKAVAAMILVSPNLRSCLVKIVDDNYENYRQGLLGYEVEAPASLNEKEIDYIFTTRLDKVELAAKLQNEYGLLTPLL